MEAADGVLVERKRVLAGIGVEADDLRVSGAIGADEDGRVTAASAKQAVPSSALVKSSVMMRMRMAIPCIVGPSILAIYTRFLRTKIESIWLIYGCEPFIQAVHTRTFVYSKTYSFDVGLLPDARTY